MASGREARLRGLGCDAVAVFAAFRARVDGIGALAGIGVADSAAIVVFRERPGSDDGEAGVAVGVAVFAAIPTFCDFVGDAGGAGGAGCVAIFDFVAVRSGIKASFPAAGAVAVFAGFTVSARDRRLGVAGSVVDVVTAAVFGEAAFAALLRGERDAVFPNMVAVADSAGLWVLAARVGFVAVADAVGNSALPRRWLPILPESACDGCRFCCEFGEGTGRRDADGPEAVWRLPFLPGIAVAVSAGEEAVFPSPTGAAGSAPTLPLRDLAASTPTARTALEAGAVADSAGFSILIG